MELVSRLARKHVWIFCTEQGLSHVWRGVGDGGEHQVALVRVVVRASYTRIEPSECLVI